MERKYSVKAAANLSGLSPDILRAWERRYGAVVPRREGKGRRIYSEADLERLQLLKRGTELGHPIRLLAPLDNEDLRRLAQENAHTLTSGVSEGLVKELIAAIDRYDLDSFEQILGRAAVALPPRDLIANVIFTLLHQVGDRWHAGELSVAQEHTICASLRNLIGALIRVYPRRPGRGSITFATLSGERHEFGALLLSLLAASDGIGVHYLGPDLPAEEIAAAAINTGSQVVAVSVVNTLEPDQQVEQLRLLYRRLEGRARLWIGGRAAESIQPRLKDLDAVWVEDIFDFENRMKLV